MGLKLVMSAGVEVIWISSGNCRSAFHRGRELGIKNIYLGIHDKAEFLADFCRQHDITLEQVAFIGDDLADLVIMRQVGLAFSPADGEACVKQVAAFITQAKGGRGAVREVCNLLVEAHLPRRTSQSNEREIEHG
jgi:YrbI family 3-deoxy-D-manno-octulosonate 8-phosphate phosphatase